MVRFLRVFNRHARARGGKVRRFTRDRVTSRWRVRTKVRVMCVCGGGGTTCMIANAWRTTRSRKAGRVNDARKTIVPRALGDLVRSVWREKKGRPKQISLGPDGRNWIYVRFSLAAVVVPVSTNVSVLRTGAIKNRETFTLIIITACIIHYTDSLPHAARSLFIRGLCV